MSVLTREPLNPPSDSPKADRMSGKLDHSNTDMQSHCGYRKNED